jgi:predicted small metal-binding protein
MRVGAEGSNVFPTYLQQRWLTIAGVGSEPREAVMARVINCECGQTIRGESDEELVSKAEAHVDANHPELVGKISREDFLGMAEEE